LQKRCLDAKIPLFTLSSLKNTGTLEQNTKNACNYLIINKKTCSNFKKTLEQRWNKRNKTEQNGAKIAKSVPVCSKKLEQQQNKIRI